MKGFTFTGTKSRRGARGGRAQEGQTEETPANILARQTEETAGQTQETPTEDVIEIFQIKLGEWRQWAKTKPEKFMEKMAWCDDYMRNYNPNGMQDWELARAVCQSKPEQVLCFAPGMTQTIILEVLNDT